MIRREVFLFICAVQFLTRVPVPHLAGFSPDWIGASARWFPLVGQLVGLLAAAVLLLAAQVFGAGLLPALLAVGAGIALTGAFHEDGLADTADGLGGGLDRDARLAIMKDSRVGTYGLLALGFAVALRVAGLATLPPWEAALALVAAHGVGRACAVVAMRATPYVRDAAEAKVKPVPQGVAPASVAVALASVLWVPFALPWAALLVAAITAWWLLRQARRLIGGHTGDVLGATEQVAATAFLLGCAAG